MEKKRSQRVFKTTARAHPDPAAAPTAAPPQLSSMRPPASPPTMAPEVWPERMFGSVEQEERRMAAPTAIVDANVFILLGGVGKLFELG